MQPQNQSNYREKTAFLDKLAKSERKFKFNRDLSIEVQSSRLGSIKRKSLNTIQDKFNTPFSVDRPIKNFKNIDTAEIVPDLDMKASKFETASTIARKFETENRIDRPIKKFKYVDPKSFDKEEKLQKNVKKEKASVI